MIVTSGRPLPPFPTPLISQGSITYLHISHFKQRAPLNYTNRCTHPRSPDVKFITSILQMVYKENLRKIKRVKSCINEIGIKALLPRLRGT